MKMKEGVMVSLTEEERAAVPSPVMVIYKSLREILRKPIDYENANGKPSQHGDKERLKRGFLTYGENRKFWTYDTPRMPSHVPFPGCRVNSAVLQTVGEITTLKRP